MFGKLAVVVFTIASLATGTAALVSTTSHAAENNGFITVNYPEDNARRASLPRSAPECMAFGREYGRVRKYAVTRYVVPGP